MPSFTLPDVDIDDVTDSATKLAKDALYITVGAGVLAFQRAQVARREVQKAVESGFGTSRQQLDRATSTLTKAFEDQLHFLDERADALEAQVDSLMKTVEAKLPSPADKVVKQAHGAARTVRTQARGLAVTTAKAAPATAARATRKANPKAA